jgi:L-fuconolactonase
MNRKNFLTTASVITLASLNSRSLLATTLAMPGKGIPIVDSHQHLVDARRFGENWSRPPIPGNYGIEEYKKATRGLNFVKAVYMEVAVPKEKRHEEALYAIELCKDTSNPTVAAVIKSDLYDPGFENYMTQFKGSSYIKGIRGSFNSVDEILNNQVIKNVKALGSMNMSLDFSVGTAWLSKMGDLVKACPETNFLINHCGNVDPRGFLDPNIHGAADHDIKIWIKDMTDLASYPNVRCKISGVATRAKGLAPNAENLGPAINQCLDIFGPDRVMFAADWPWCLEATDIKNWVQILKKVVSGRPYTDQKKLFHDNAIKFYNI